MFSWNLNTFTKYTEQMFSFYLSIFFKWTGCVCSLFRHCLLFAPLAVQKRKLKPLVWPPPHSVVNFNKSLNMNKLFLCIISQRIINNTYFLISTHTRCAFKSFFMNLHTPSELIVSTRLEILHMKLCSSNIWTNALTFVFTKKILWD